MTTHDDVDQRGVRIPHGPDLQPRYIPSPVGYPPPVHSFDEIKAMVHACYRDLIEDDGEWWASATAHALAEQLMGRAVESLRVSYLLVDVWMNGRKCTHTHMPGRIDL